MISQVDGCTLGTLGERDSIILGSIGADPDMVFEWKLHKDTSARIVSLAAILYAPLNAFNEIGDYLEEVGYFLRDPLNCGRNVRYRNPHQLSGLDANAPMTSELGTRLKLNRGGLEQFTEPVDLLNGFESRQAIKETEPPAAIQTPLYSHQKRALRYMLDRECGWDLSTDRDVWSMIDQDLGPPSYRNNISGGVQLDPPPQFRGGLLADEMGLGKTLTVLSLIASDQEGNRHNEVSRLGDPPSLFASLAHHC